MASPPSSDAADQRDQQGGDGRLVAALGALGRMGLQGELRRLVCMAASWDLREPRVRAELEADGMADWRFMNATMSWSADGRMVAAACERMICVWDVEGGVAARVEAGHRSGRDGCSCGVYAGHYDEPRDASSCEMPGHSYIINSIALSPDGATLCSVADDSTIRLWDVATMEERGRMHAMPRHHGASFSDDGTKLLACFNDALINPNPDGSGWQWDAGDPDAVRVWDVSVVSPPEIGAAFPPPLVLTPPGGMVVHSAAFAPDGARVVACCKRKAVGDAMAEVWHGCIVTWSLGGGGEDAQVREVAGLAWNHGWENLDIPIQPEWIIGAGGMLSVAINANHEGPYMDRVCVVDMASGRMLVVCEDHTEDVSSASVNADGRYLLLRVGGFETGGELWSVHTGRRVWSAPVTVDVSMPPSFGPDGRSFVTSSPDKTSIRVWR